MSKRTNNVVSDSVEVRDEIASQLGKAGVAILPPLDIAVSTKLLHVLGFHAQACVLDPWYNMGVGGVRDDYEEYIVGLLADLAPTTDHLFLWGFPGIVARFVPRLPQELALRCWVTWFFKNAPTRIRGWRSAQMACLHLTKPNAVMHVENFLNDVQKDKLAKGKLQYIPGPPSVIEESLLCGFVGRDEQTGHPAQKPLAVIERLILMATARGELAIDLMCGSGTTGEACLANERYAIICDISEEYTRICEERLGVTRLKFDPALLTVIASTENGLPHERIALPASPPRPPTRKGKSENNQFDLRMK